LLKFALVQLIILIIFALFALHVGFLHSAVAASPDKSRAAFSPVAQESGITLQKTASSELVALGQHVTYTLALKNESAETITLDLRDVLPAGLSLQNRSVTSTLEGVIADDNVVSWSGQLEGNSEASITYAAVPPSTSSPGENLENTAVVHIGSRTVESSATITTEAPDLGLWGRFINALAWVLVATDEVLEGFGIPYAFGFAIILFTVVVRLATFPLNMQQIKSSKAMQELQPKMQEIQKKYKDDREKLAQEQMKLYKEHGVNPLGGCLPLLVQMPVWFGLYQALIQLSGEGLLNKGFFWIPSLAGPVTSNFGGLEWLWPFPPAVGWPAAIAYLVLPVLLVISQLYMQQMMTPPTTDPQQASMQSIMKFMPLMFGYFALVVPSG
jgi:YidC/Oxa1 family membrane protein insertase